MEFYRIVCHFCSKFVRRKICVEKNDKYEVWRVPGAVLSWLTRQSFLWFCNNCSSALTPTPSLKHSWSLTRKPSLLLRNPITKLEPSKYKDTKKAKTIIYWRMDSFGVTASQMDRVLAFLDVLPSLHFNLSVSESVICFSVNQVMQVI